MKKKSITTTNDESITENVTENVSESVSEDVSKDVSDKTSKETEKELSAKSREKLRAYYREMVPVMLIKDNHRYKDDVTVTHNGVNWLIQRGKNVMVPRYIKRILEDSFRQQMYSDELSNRLSEEFAKKAESINM